MRPHRVFNCVLWLLLGGISIHVIFYFIIPLITLDGGMDSDYISINRDVKELKVDHFSMKHSLLSKLSFQVFDILNFNPDPNKGPLALHRLRPRRSTDNGSRDGRHVDRSFRNGLYGKKASIMNSSDLLMLLHRINRLQHIINIQQFPNTEFVIVVQVHNRMEYLTILIDSLLSVKDIHRTLLVFSHDIYSSEINFLIRSIRFAPVLQIFFPFSQQVFQTEFPGLSSKDCSVKLKKNSPDLRNCFNSNWSDSYDNYRDFRYTQTKHHWTWKANFVFERVRLLKTFESPVVFIEEDHYLVEDFVHVLRLMWREKMRLHPTVSILSLGTYEKSHHFNPSSKVQFGTWVSSFHNMGMTFNRTIWNRIKACSKNFCEFDDYNWDWSLQHVNKACVQDGFEVMLLKFAPRIFHIGECGIHHKKTVCDPYIVLHKIRKLLNGNMQFLYPTGLIKAGPTNVRNKIMRPNGGWTDLRDQTLCRHLLLNSAILDNTTLASGSNPLEASLLGRS